MTVTWIKKMNLESFIIKKFNVCVCIKMYAYSKYAESYVNILENKMVHLVNLSLWAEELNKEIK